MKNNPDPPPAIVPPYMLLPDAGVSTSTAGVTGTVTGLLILTLPPAPPEISKSPLVVAKDIPELVTITLLKNLTCAA